MVDRIVCEYFEERYPDGNYPDTWYDTYQEKCEKHACDQAQEELAAAAANSTFEGSIMFLEYYCEQDCEGVEGAICEGTPSAFICEEPEPVRESRTIFTI